MANPNQPEFLSFNPMIDKIFFCRVCKTHIAKINDLSTHFEGFVRAEPFFINVINVHILNPMVRTQIRGEDVVNVQCMRCNNLLGTQYFVTPNAGGIPIVRNCMLDLKKLMKWDGEKIVDGSETAEYSMFYYRIPQDFNIEPWYADSAAGRAGLEIYVLASRMDHQFFACRRCRTEIAKAKDYLTHRQGLKLAEPIFSNIVNVHTVGPSVEQMTRACLVRNVHCNQCGNLLGKQLPMAPQVNSIRVCRDYIPDLKKLLKWDGENYVIAENTRMFGKRRFF